MCDLATISVTILATILHHAYVEIRQKKTQKEYTKASLIRFRSAIQRQLAAHKREANFIDVKSYNKATQPYMHM